MFNELNPDMSTVNLLVGINASVVSQFHSLVYWLTHLTMVHWLRLCFKQDARGWGSTVNGRLRSLLSSWWEGGVAAAKGCGGAWVEHLIQSLQSKGSKKKWCIKRDQTSVQLVRNRGEENRDVQAESVDVNAQRPWESFVLLRKWKLPSVSNGSWPV